MHRGRGMDIIKSDYLLILIYQCDRYFFTNHFAKNTRVTHIPSLMVEINRDILFQIALDYFIFSFGPNPYLFL